jgi:predicted TIM-barrel fold metal-dependent hydrolase
MIIDGHAHIFTPQVIANVSSRSAMAEKLHLDISGAQVRTNIAALRRESFSAGVGACLILPTAVAGKVREVNITFRKIAHESGFLFTAGTLHPQYDANEEELSQMLSEGVQAIKLCSFSQGFSLSAPQTHNLFKLVEETNKAQKCRFFVMFDTLYLAHKHFGTLPEHNTTPAMLGDIVAAYPGIDFVAAHMGGLDAPPEEIFTYLPPSDNLYLETSNAAYTLSEGDFVRLLKIHGPEHIIFGTDWPWFGHRDEIKLLDKLLDRAGFDKKEKGFVFTDNIASLLGVSTSQIGCFDQEEKQK